MFTNFANFLLNHTPLLYFTQSLWRDEAFSVLVGSPGGIETIKITAADYNPPLYYLILNVWMQIFGKSEIAIRLLSLLFFAGFVFVCFKFAQKLFKGKLPLILTLLIALNPMLLYYGLEARMYSLYALTTTASMYFFFTKKWRSYVVATTAALYTHPYTVFVPLTQAVYLFLRKKITKKTLFTLVLPFVFYLPWIFVIIKQFQTSKEMWIYPVNINLILSVVGNLFINYEGTPWFLWPYMKYLSGLLILLYLWSFTKAENRKNYLLFYLWFFLPLILVLGVSVLKPIFVNRYLITVSVAQIFLIVIGVNSFKNKLLKKTLFTAFVLLSIFFLLFLPPYIKKVNIRKTFTEVNQLLQENDLIYANSPLVFFESTYYAHNPASVFLYNPDLVRLPGYLGTILIPPEKQTNRLPEFPKRAFLIFEDGDFELFSAFPRKYGQ